MCIRDRPFEILKMDKRRGNIVVSRRTVLEESRAEQRSEIVQNLEEGQVVEGVVKNITDYGAFVDLGGIDGLLHVTDMARTPTGMDELDRVLGGGIVEGGVVLIGGDPGIGKSTLLLQALDALQRSGQPTLYVTCLLYTSRSHSAPPLMRISSTAATKSALSASDEKNWADMMV